MEAIQFSRQDVEDDIKYLLKGFQKPKKEKFFDKVKKWFKNLLGYDIL